MTPEPRLSVEKQYELMYLDMVHTIAERKRTLFDLSRWIVTVQTAILAGAMIEAVVLPAAFAILPLLVGAMGWALNRGIVIELGEHRRAVARMRMAVGGDFEAMHQDMVNHFGRGRPRSGRDYWHLISNSHSLIILASSLVVFSMVLLLGP